MDKNTIFFSVQNKFMKELRHVHVASRTCHVHVTSRACGLTCMWRHVHVSRNVNSWLPFNNIKHAHIKSMRNCTGMSAVPHCLTLQIHLVEHLKKFLIAQTRIASKCLCFSEQSLELLTCFG